MRSICLHHESRRQNRAAQAGDSEGHIAVLFPGSQDWCPREDSDDEDSDDEEPVAKKAKVEGKDKKKKKRRSR